MMLDARPSKSSETSCVRFLLRRPLPRLNSTCNASSLSDRPSLRFIDDDFLARQCVEEYGDEERSKPLWTEVIQMLSSMPHDQPREEKLAIVAGICEPLLYVSTSRMRVAWTLNLHTWTMSREPRPTALSQGHCVDPVVREPPKREGRSDPRHDPGPLPSPRRYVISLTRLVGGRGTDLSPTSLLPQARRGVLLAERLRRDLGDSRACWCVVRSLPRPGLFVASREAIH